MAAPPFAAEPVTAASLPCLQPASDSAQQMKIQRVRLHAPDGEGAALPAGFYTVRLRAVPAIVVRASS